MTKHDIEKKYSDTLKTFNEPTFEKGLLAVLKDLINHSEGIWDYQSIRYDTVMTKTEWVEFSEHPDRAPYKTKISEINNKNYNDIFDYIIELLKDIFPYYKSLKKSGVKEDLRKSINSLIESAFNARYETEEIREHDLYVGRTELERDNGEIKITEISKSRYDYAILEYSKNTGKDFDELKKSILDLCDNDLLKLADATSTCDIEPTLAKDISEIHSILSRDLTLQFGSVRLAWKVWQTFRDIGIDTDEYLNLLGLPKFALVKKRLLAFMSDKDMITETLEHMKDDLPNSYSKYIKEGQIDRIEIAIENAQRKEYPKQLRKDSEVINMVTECQTEIFNLFPLTSSLDTRNVILNPTHPAATQRASNSTIKNRNGLPVNTVIMTPRSDLKIDYLPTFAHEITHALHRKILNMGEQAGILKKGTSDSVSSAVMEDFSQLVDDRFQSDKELPYTKKFTGKEFPSFYSAFSTRFQVPFSLIQLSIRKEFDNLYDSGFRGMLSEQMIWDLKYKFDKLAHEWFSLGVNIKSKSLTAFRLLAPYNPRDGVVYMRRYMVSDTPKQVKTTQNSDNSKRNEQSSMSMSAAFIKRWGNDWIKNIDARIMLSWLLLETGRNEKTESYYKFILNKDIEECRIELKQIGAL